MAIGPIEMTGQVTRATDIQLLRNQDDNKTFFDHSHAQGQVEKTVNDKSNAVINKDDASYHEEKYDASKEGRGGYAGNSGNGKNKQEKENDGKVVIKGQSSFDVKI